LNIKRKGTRELIQCKSDLPLQYLEHYFETCWGSSVGWFYILFLRVKINTIPPLKIFNQVPGNKIVGMKNRKSAKRKETTGSKGENTNKSLREKAKCQRNENWHQIPFTHSYGYFPERSRTLFDRPPIRFS
jgi:hypothetical protein